MIKQVASPRRCHIFVCTNNREGRKKSCADGNSPQIRDLLKEEIEKRGWKKNVRVSQCGCVGLCEEGPAAIIYPQNIWFVEVTPDSVGVIFARIEEILGSSV